MAAECRLTEATSAPTVSTSLPRARTLLFLVAVAAYLTSLGNGFAYDDNWFIVGNPVVTEALIADAFLEPAWPDAPQGVGNYRPVVLTSFAVEWAVFGGDELGFHVVSVLAQGLISLLVLALLLRFVPLLPAFLASLVFAVHPVHVEAVANVMGRAELYAALGYLGACLVYLNWRPAGGLRRGLRLLALAALSLFAMGSKEIAVTLPAALIALELFRHSDAGLRQRFREEALTIVGLVAVMALYVIVRGEVLGTFTGESASPALLGLSVPERLLTALTVWPHYLRLMFFPLDLSADYGPGVILPTHSLTLEAISGAVLIVALLGGAWLLRRRAPTVSLGALWFFVTILPVSNLVVRADIVLAERTLYLPSVGLALGIAGMVHHLAGEIPMARRRVLLGLFAVFVVGMFVRTVTRNPAWMDTYSVVSTLAADHPESWLALRARGGGLERVGALAEAGDVYDIALAGAPNNYQLLVEVAGFKHRIGDHEGAEELLARAIQLLPDYSVAYERLSEQKLLDGDGRSAHAVALAGLARVGSHRGLWALVSESYVAKGDLDAAVRARRAALGQDSTSVSDWTRLGDLLELAGDTVSAEAARAHATSRP